MPKKSFEELSVKPNSHPPTQYNTPMPKGLDDDGGADAEPTYDEHEGYTALPTVKYPK